MTARERIGMLLDKGTLNELDKLVNHRCTNFGMEKKQIAEMVWSPVTRKDDGIPVALSMHTETHRARRLTERNQCGQE